MDNRTKSNFNKIEYCLGNGLELLSAPVCSEVWIIVCSEVWTAKKWTIEQNQISIR